MKKGLEGSWLTVDLKRVKDDLRRISKFVPETGDASMPVCFFSCPWLSLCIYLDEPLHGITCPVCSSSLLQLYHLVRLGDRENVLPIYLHGVWELQGKRTPKPTSRRPWKPSRG
jgi:hypothetical protein